MSHTMRLWTVHPRYLDARGLAVLWREGVLARAALRGRTARYRAHPQLERFRAHAMPRSAINAYLEIVQLESARRGQPFDRREVGPSRPLDPIRVTSGQLAHEWRHLLRNLRARSPADYARWRRIRKPEPHPIFLIVPGGVERWERTS